MATRPDPVAAEQRQAALIRERVLRYLAAVWSASTSFRDVDVDRIVAAVVPRVHAGMLQVATLTDAAIGQAAVRAGVTWTSGVDRTVVDYRGTPAAEVYRRPAVQLYSELAAGAAFDVARQHALERLLTIAKTDIQQARNRQAATSLSHSGFVGYRRTLTGAENCALCVIASTQRYTVGDLMPIHPGCDCGVAGFKARSDPGQVLDPELLEEAHQLVEQKFGVSDRGAREPDYRDFITVNEHGELGPTLAWRDEHFTSAADIESGHGDH